MTTPDLKELIRRWNGGKYRGSQKAFAAALAVSEPTVSRWIRGDYPPDEDQRGRVAELLGISVPQLLELFPRSKAADRGTVYKIAASDQFMVAEDLAVRNIPHLGVISASRFSFTFDAEPGYSMPMAVKRSAAGRHAILKISGDCMAPTIDDGDEVLIRETSVVQDGDIAVVYLDGECTLKRVYKKKEGVRLVADNEKYPPMTLKSSKVQVLAKVEKILKEPRRKA